MSPFCSNNLIRVCWLNDCGGSIVWALNGESSIHVSFMKNVCIRL